MKERTWLKEMRTEKSMTQRQVAEACGKSESYYSQIESGKRSVPVSTAKAIAKVLNFDWVLFY